MNKLDEILEKHSLWINDKEVGERADLKGADLEDADLKGADLRDADLRDADLNGADLRDADLRDADLKGADLRDADLKGANLDYSCFPLWCGGVGWEVDKNLPNILAAFICSMKCEDDKVKEMQGILLPYAKDSHRCKDILEAE